MSIVSFSAPIVVHADDEIPDFADIVEREDSDGNFVISTTRAGRNIGNVRCEGYQAAPPQITYDGQRQALPRHVGYSDGYWPPGIDEFTGEPLEKEDAGFRAAIVEMAEFEPDWKSIGADVEYFGRHLVTIFFSELPKVWFAETVEAEIPVVGGFEFFQVLNQMTFERGAIRIFYDFELPPIQVTAGSGVVKRTITDTSYRPEFGSGNTNIDKTTADMTTRANSELARLNHVQKSGSITVLGDETLDLRTIVSGMDVLSVTHRFTNGFTTVLQLTNEIAINEIIPEIKIEIPQTNTVLDTRDVVNVHTFSIFKLDQDGNITRVTPSNKISKDATQGPDAIIATFGD